MDNGGRIAPGLDTIQQHDAIQHHDAIQQHDAIQHHDAKEERDTSGAEVEQQAATPEQQNRQARGT